MINIIKALQSEEQNKANTQSDGDKLNKAMQTNNQSDANKQPKQCR